MTAPGVAAVPSLRRRLSRFVLLLALAWTAVATVVLGLWLRHEVHELLDDSLVATSAALALVLQQDLAPGAAVGGRGPGPVRPDLLPRAGSQARPPADPRTQPQAGDAAAMLHDPAGGRAAARQDETSFAWQVVDGRGQLLARSPNAPQQVLAGRLVEGFVDAPAGWRVRARELPAGRWLLVGQQASERLEATLEVAGGTIAAALLVSLAGLAWLRWRLARETQPLADLGEVLGRYDPLRTGQSLPPPALEELAPVHRAVQQMGERLAAHAAAERAFSAHAAHALRTPLAGLDAQLAVAQREAPAALQPRLARLRGATARLSRVVGALLALFRSSGTLRRAPVDVAALLARMPLDGLTLELEGPLALPAADEDLIAAALINLLDNSLRHGARRVRVRVQDSHITLTDDGPGVDPPRLAQLRQTLAREDAGLSVHDDTVAGLGLALADRVARAHGGRLELLQVPSGFGVRLWLQAPLQEPTAAAAIRLDLPAAPGAPGAAMPPPLAPAMPAEASVSAPGVSAAAKASAGTLRRA